jgi:hypothetical protein
MIWEEYLDQCECTKCKNIFLVPDYGESDWLNKPNFCPFCGKELAELKQET